ncbi:MAG: hypothetical protein QXQ50_09840, partial [Candidatus Bathyarchaeia archaeon]
VLQKTFTSKLSSILWWLLLDVKLLVDGEEISLNKFVVKILGGTIVGAVSALRGVKEDWKEIKVEIRR